MPSVDLLDVVVLDPDRGPTKVRAAFHCPPELVGAAVRPFLPDGPDSDDAVEALQDCVNRGADLRGAQKACHVEISPHDPARWAATSTWLQDRI